MALPSDLITQFAKIVNKREEPVKESTVYGTIVESDGKRYVRFDGSNILTPVATTVGMLPGERVIVSIKNHTAVVTGNMTSPAARIVEVDEIEKSLSELTNNFGQLDESIKEIIGNMETSEEGVLLLGNAETPVTLVGSDVYHYVASAGAIYKPYYEAGDVISTFKWYGAAHIDSSYRLCFSIPLVKPVIGDAIPIVTSTTGMIVFRNTAYLYGSSSTKRVSPVSIATELVCDGGMVNCICTFSENTNASTGFLIGIDGEYTIEFVNSSTES